MTTLRISTPGRTAMVDVTAAVRDVVRKSGIGRGVVIVFVPHTTAGVTINENADPDVQHDILLTLDKLIPQDDPRYRHGEGNSDAHVKASLLGSAVTVLVEAGELVLGTWQGIYLAEFDGPRERKLHVRVVEHA